MTPPATSAPMAGESPRPLLAVRGVSKHFAVGGGIWGRAGSVVRALDDVSFEVPHGITVGLVGESGCGKTTLGHTIMGGLSADGGAKMTQQDKMKTCNADAKTKALAGDARKAFMKTCLSNKPA